jgi:hypothetical protein
MTRKVSVSRKLADQLVALKNQAAQQGMADSFRAAWIKIWKALHQRPLPPDESAHVFGEIRYRSKKPPRYAFCIACVRPLSVEFAVCEEKAIVAGQLVEPVIVVRVTLMS